MAVAVLAITGFSIAGALAVGSSVASHAAQALGSKSAATLNAEKVSPQLAAQLHGFGAVGKGKLVTAQTSTNWGGYADVATEGTILESLGYWNVNAINCNVYPAIADNWVGIDGWTTGTVEQGGTYAYCNSNGAGPYYWDWFEFYPYESIQSVNQVNAGDLIQAYVLYSPHTCENGVCGIYTIVVEDLSNPSLDIMAQGNPSTCNTAGCEGGPDGSVECISESLVDQGSYLPDYGTTKFISCDAEINGYYSGIGGLPAGAHATVDKITTYGYDSGLKQQVPSGLKTYDWKNDQFTIAWKQYD